jgi:hypothetical protein
MINALRWLLIVPMAFAGWLIAFVGGLELYDLINHFCPPEHQLSDSCQHPAAQLVEEILVSIAAATAAMLVIVFATLTAPAYRPQVATGTLILGLATAAWAYLETGALGAFIAACLAGAMTYWLMIRRLRPKPAVSGYQYELFI